MGVMGQMYLMLVKKTVLDMILYQCFTYAQIFTITQNGFGENKADEIKSLDDSLIILLGSYEMEHYLYEGYFFS